MALKHAVDAWAAAPAGEKAARFASAETVRWLEWAARGYHAFVLGLALLLYGGAIMGTGRLPRGLGGVLGLGGLADWGQGWIVSGEGFSPAIGLPTLLTIVLFLAGSLWLLLWGRRRPAWEAVRPGLAGPGGGGVRGGDSRRAGPAVPGRGRGAPVRDVAGGTAFDTDAAGGTGLRPA